MLQQRSTTKLRWTEAWIGFSETGERFSPVVTITATVEDCIRMARVRMHTAMKYTVKDEEDLLLDYISINNAEVVQNLSGLKLESDTPITVTPFP